MLKKFWTLTVDFTGGNMLTSLSTINKKVISPMRDFNQELGMAWVIIF